MGAQKLILKVSLLLLLVAIVESVMLFGPFKRAALRHTYIDEWVAKHDHLLAPGRDRLILAGGSNVAFGLDSSALQAATHRETINLGLLGDLGLAFMLHEVEEGARSGDWVVLFPEYEHFFGDLMNGELATAELIQYHRSALRYLFSWRQMRNLFKNVAIVNARTSIALLDRAKASVLGHFNQADEEAPRDEQSTVYTKDAFDNHGDMVAHLDREPKPEQIVEATARIKGNPNEGAVREIVQCAEMLATRGVHFFVVYPAVSASYWALNRDLVQHVADRLPVPLTVTDPEDWVLADDAFYDTPYHLNRKGRHLRTTRLARVLETPR